MEGKSGERSALLAPEIAVNLLVEHRSWREDAGETTWIGGGSKRFYISCQSRAERTKVIWQRLCRARKGVGRAAAERCSGLKVRADPLRKQGLILKCPPHQGNGESVN